MNPNYKDALSYTLARKYQDLEERIIEDIVRRIRKAGEITSTADWQINQLVMISGYSSEDIEKIIKETLGTGYPEMFELYDKVIEWEYVRNKNIYEQINEKFVPYEENHQLQQIVEALVRQTKGELDNITRSMGFYIDYGNGRRVLTPLAQVYQDYLDAGIFDITSGAFDYNSVLRRVVTQLTNSGLRMIDYASGWANRVDVGARRAVMTGITQLTSQISDMNAEQLGTDYFEVAWHAGARPTHQIWQGKVYTREQLVTICGLGTVTGLEGVNCYHERYPFFPGISERNWTDEWLEAKNQEENTPKEWHGKEYTLYEAKQKQRQMETAMRAQREKVKMLQVGGAESDEVMIAKAKYQAQLDEYARFSKKMRLKQERERIYMDIQGRVAPGNSAKKVIEAKLEKMYNKGNLLDNIKIYEKDMSLRQRIRSGLVFTQVESGKQGKHIRMHSNYIQGRSYLTVSETEVQNLVNKYAGSGKLLRDSKDEWRHREIVMADEVIGYSINQVTGVEIPTKCFTIHYSKKGVHIVPTEERQDVN